MRSCTTSTATKSFALCTTLIVYFPGRHRWRTWAASWTMTMRGYTKPRSTNSFMKSTGLIICSPTWFCSSAWSTLRSTARPCTKSKSTDTLIAPSLSSWRRLTSGLGLIFAFLVYVLRRRRRRWICVIDSFCILYSSHLLARQSKRAWETIRLRGRLLQAVLQIQSNNKSWWDIGATVQNPKEQNEINEFDFFWSKNFGDDGTQW